MKKIYAVNAGDYSDYRIVAVFSSRKKAEDFQTAVPDSYGYNDIEEFELDPNTADLIHRGYAVWRVHMLVDGTTERVEKTASGIYDVNNVGHSIWRRTQAPAYQGKGIPDCLVSNVWAKTKKQAIKIANEQRIQMIANNQWPT